MTNRKFTPPTEFPAGYVDGKGNKAVILGRGPNEVFPFIGYDCDGDAFSWTEHGEGYPEEGSLFDLHDIPKRITTWHNVHRGHEISYPYSSREEADDNCGKGRLCVYRIESDGNPEIFVEEV